MGQRINTYTLRSSKAKVNTFNLSVTSKESIYLYSYFKFLENFFWRKKIFLTNIIMYSFGNTYIFNFFIFFRYASWEFYFGKKSKYKKLKFLKKKIFINEKKLKTIFQSFSLFKKNLIIFKFNNLSVFLRKKRIFVAMYFFFKKEAAVMFPRRFNFFLEFLQLSILLIDNKITVNFFIKIFVEMFRILQKKRHSKFLAFIDIYFKFLTKSKRYNKFHDLNFLAGIKIKISGKLKGKPRSSHFTKVFGAVPIQTLKAPIEYSKAHAFTIYGVFGIQLWIYRSKNYIR